VNPSNYILYGTLVYTEECPVAQTLLLSQENQQEGMLQKGT